MISNTNTFNIIGIDPGNNLGVSILSISNTTFEIVDIITETIVLNNHINLNSADIMTERLNFLTSYLTNLYRVYNPVIVCFEQAFLNIRFPKAVVQLTQYTTIIEALAIQHSPFLKVFKYPPKYIKREIGATGNADKDGMSVAVSKNPLLADYVNNNILTEHEVDALAISFLGYDLFRYNPWQVLMFN